MSSKNSYLLFSTCLSVLALSVPMTSHAGFEWMPPKNEVKSAIPDPVEVQPIMEDQVTEKPEMKPNTVDDAVIKHMREMQVQTEKQMVPVSKDVEVSGSVMQSRTLSVQEEEVSAEVAEMEKAVEEQTADEMSKIEAIVEEAVAEETVVEETVTEASEEQTEDDGIITINPFPLEEDQDDQEQETTQVIALPSDSDKPIEEMTEEDIVANPSVEAKEAIVEIDNTADALDDIKWNSSNTLEGFGFDMPLAVALGQIVPPHYAYAFGKGVNPGALVSWEGGKSWKDVLTESLASVNVSYVVKDKTIHLKSLIDLFEADAEDDIQEEASVTEPAVTVVAKDEVVEAIGQDEDTPDSAIDEPVIVTEIDQDEPTPISSKLLEAQKKTLP